MSDALEQAEKKKDSTDLVEALKLKERLLVASSPPINRRKTEKQKQKPRPRSAEGTLDVKVAFARSTTFHAKKSTRGGKLGGGITRAMTKREKVFKKKTIIVCEPCLLLP